MIFVIGTGRCGTVSFHKMLLESDIDSYHELNNEEGVSAQWVESIKYCSTYPINEVFARTWLEPMIRSLPGQAHVNHYFGRILPLLDELLPDSKYVWLIREARSCVESMNRHPMWFNREAPWERWNLIAPWTGDMDMAEWEALTKVGKCAWTYTWDNNRIRDTLPDGKWLQFRLEDFGDLRKREAVFKWLGAKIPRTAHENALEESLIDWTEQEELEFQRFCGDREMPKGSKVHKMYTGMRKQGYSKAKAAKIAQAKTGTALATGKPPKRKQKRKKK